MTVETTQALAVSGCCYVLNDDTAVHSTVAEYCPDVRDLAFIYEDQPDRASAYRAISELLVETAATATHPVSFIAHGHPLFLVSATELTLKLARDQGLRVRTLPGVSSFDTILCDLEIDYGYGVQIYDATTLIKNAWQINPQVPLLVFSISTTLNEDIVTGRPEAATVRPLVQWLLRTYPPHHRCDVVHSPAHLLGTTHIANLALDALEVSDDLELWRRPTLYVPALSSDDA